MPHADFLQLVLGDEVTGREAGSIALRAKNAGLDPAMRTESCPAASGELSSCRSSMIRTKRSHGSSSSDGTLSTMALPLEPAATGGSCAPPSPVLAAARTARPPR
jgi:hypothetical protein